MSSDLPSVVALCGYSRTGKDTAAVPLIERGYRMASSGWAVAEFMCGAGFVVNGPAGPIAFADLLGSLGYEDAKMLPGIVGSMQRVGVALKAIQPDIVMRMTLAGLAADDLVIVSGMRSPAEAALVRDHGGVVLRIHRPGVSSSGPADDMVDGIDPDWHIVNDGTVAELHEQILEALRDTCALRDMQTAAR